jgi:DNA-directed RNA polymerase specialized sigma24 family protein
VAQKATGARGADDAELLNKVRTGDTTAFGVLYQRHVQAVRRLARELVMSPAEADHLVAETFALVHDVTQRGGGPTDAFRPYVLTALRRVAADQVRDWRGLTAGRPDPGEPLAAPSPDDSHVIRAFLSLPERWRAVLWHTDIEGEPSADVAPLLGVSPAGVAELRRSAREGLRQAIVRTYIARTARPECQPTAGRLDEYQRGALAEPEAAPVAAHLDQCTDCAAACAALGDITAALRNQVAPVFLGPATTQYLLGARNAIAAGPGAPPPADTGEFSAMAAGATAGRLHRLGRLPRRAWVGGASVLAACAVAAVAIAATGTPHRSGPGNAADSHVSVDIKASADPGQLPVRSPESSPSAKPRTRHHRTARAAPSATAGATTSPTVAPAPKATTSPAPAAVAKLSAAVSLDGSRHFLSVSFQVNDTGNAATGQLSATITLPAGAVFAGSGHQGGNGGWTCQPASGGASCQHPAIAAGTEAAGMIFVFAAGQACGQPVQLAAASGSVSANAQSPQDIQCQ